MPRRFHSDDELLAPATFIKRLMAVVYDGLISVAVLLVTTWAYTIVAGYLIGWDRYEQMAEEGSIGADPALTFVLFLVLYLFFGYFWTRTGQTLGMQAWRIRVQNLNGLSVSWTQALRRYVAAAAILFVALLGAYYLNAATLFVTIPAIVALFYPINGLSLTDRASASMVAVVPKA
ncbi:RDD family protein [Marinobacter confluentis]|uniref:RDD family protein n=1 Tax=Marinobacter confluentis TaxID=1697557 RepID=A0A4Z1BUV7_9GAMM|nr:RDD family protein [Marinobacter confluentis]TGN41925.1 RDD family protein [Marinobacter confluentis]